MKPDKSMTKAPDFLRKSKKVKPYAIWILIPISTAFLAGYLSLYIWNSPRSPNVKLDDIDQILEKFVKEHRAKSKIDFAQIYPDGDFKELLDPSFAFPQTTKFKFSEIKSLYDFAKNCGKPPVVSKPLEKTLTWHSYKCGQRNQLPSGFFSTQPLVHPSGASFARLNGQNLDWLLKHLNLVHTLELFDLKKSFGENFVLPSPYEEISKLYPMELQSILDGHRLLISQDFILLKQEPVKENFKSFNFDVFDKITFNKFLESTNVSAALYKPGSQCFLIQGSVCWSYRPSVIYKWTNYQLIVLFLGTILTLGFSLFILDKKSKSERLMGQKLKFGLQTLTHELRTPVTSLSLNLENLRGQFDSLNLDSQTSLLGALNDLERLKHTTEKSRKYLSDYHLDKLIEINKETIPSLGQFLKAVSEPFSSHVNIHDAENVSLNADPYWLGVCLTNLVKNAVTHGTSPVTINYKLTDKWIEINISDCGKFNSNSQNKNLLGGLGLGIYIVETTLKSMNGKLKVSQNPTTFSILLERS